MPTPKDNKHNSSQKKYHHGKMFKPGDTKYQSTPSTPKNFEAGHSQLDPQTLESKLKDLKQAQENKDKEEEGADQPSYTPPK